MRKCPMAHLTVQELARIAKVSPSVVSAVLGSTRSTTRVSEETRERIKALAKELNYHPNPHARIMRTRGDTAAYVSSHWDHGFDNRLRHVIGEAFQSARKPLEFLVYPPGSPTAFLPWLQSFGFPRIILNALWWRLKAEEKKDLSRSCEAILLIQRPDANEVLPENVSYLEIQFSPILEAITALARERGSRRLAVLYPGKNGHGPRGETLRRHASLSGGAFDYDRDVFHIREQDDPGIYQTVKDLAPRYDLLFAHHDAAALVALRAAADAGLRVPEDLGVIGMDDLPFAAYLSPPLTTVGYEMAEYGRRALAWFAGEAVDPYIPHRLIRRKSA